MKVQPNDPGCHGKPLWVVYGHDAFPSILCCRLKQDEHQVTIWGFSIHRRSAGFRTLGMCVETWAKRYDLVKFFDDHAEAIEYITKLTTPMGAK